MGRSSRVLLRSLSAGVAIVLALAVVGCAASAKAPPTPKPQEVFNAKVAAGDNAWAAGEARSAYESYAAALEVEGARDASGTVAAKRDEAERLMLSREILNTAARDYKAVAQYVEVLQYASADSTEAPAARSMIVSIIGASSREMRTDVSSLRAAIKSSRGASFPQSASALQDRAGYWRKHLDQIPNSGGARAISGLDSLLAAAKQVDKAFGREYANDALRDLESVGKLLDQADRELDAFESGS